MGIGTAIIAVLIILGPLSAARRTLTLTQPARGLAEFWDARHEFIKTAKADGATDLVVPLLPYSADLEDIESDPNHWVNSCAAQYYGIQSIVAR